MRTTQGKPLSPTQKNQTREHRNGWLTRAVTHEQGPVQEPALGWKCWTAAGEVLDKPESPNSRGAQNRKYPQYCEIYLEELDQVPTVNTEGQSRMLLAGGGGKEPS